MSHIRAGIDHEVEKGTFIHTIRSKQLDKRALSVISVNFFLQATGAIFASLNVIFFGGSIQTAGFLAVGALGLTLNPSVAVKSAIVAMMIVTTTGFSLGWAPTSQVLSAEIPSMRLRDITFRTDSVIGIELQFTVAFMLPYLLNTPYTNLPRVQGLSDIRYSQNSVLLLVFAYLGVPERMSRTLENVNMLFEMKNPVRNFQNTVLLPAARKQGHDEQDEETASEITIAFYLEKQA
ncbi:hypothetical protein CORC01_04669 [Colletotrichum orchidophilum]|uniref:Uncharacterized protein n=1 Tax=Colletotrichum orchidophilum TaxID=1209926 RepID=A0A1G4BFD0_9PEZI|nr:uncharacterized protein CORC01_04669 [Colletotrichum orchidophilum]OHF00023.1 hypothetical protein CORC01_04669 [Colletotrichum orchidophilum]